MAGKPSPRLFVIFAAKAHVAAVIKRGPSAWVEIIRWDTQRDAFDDGAWFRGRIYEEKCDVSPDGELFLYFCHGGRMRAGYTDSWTAVSRLPWLHALALWPSGTTYGGGGRFTGAREVVIRTGMALVPHPDHPGAGLTAMTGSPDVHRSTGAVEGAEWSGVDHDGRIVYARDGKLFRKARRKGASDAELADYNGRRPRPVEAPEWAKAPLVTKRRRS